MLNVGRNPVGDGNPEWNITTEPTTEPITLSEIKTYARIDGSAENDILESFIISVRQAAENYLGRSLITQSLTLSLDYWPCEVIKLPRPPLVSITEVRTLDESGTTTTYSSDNYYISNISDDKAKLVLKQGVSYPSNTERDHGGFEIEYVAGYGLASAVPNAINEAMKLWVAIVYENRVPIEDPPDIAKTLMNYYRIFPI